MNFLLLSSVSCPFEVQCMTIWGIKPFIPPLATPLRTPSCDGHTNRQTHSHSIHCGGIASCGKTIAICATLLKQYCIKHCDNFNTAVLEQPWSYVGCMYTAYAGMLCDLDETVGRTCVLQSPSITSAWTCMRLVPAVKPRRPAGTRPTGGRRTRHHPHSAGQ